MFKTELLKKAIRDNLNVQGYMDFFYFKTRQKYDLQLN